MRRPAFLAAMTAFALLGACKPQRKPAPKPTAAPARVDAAAQKRAYDLGVAHFSEERYPEAKKAWQEAVKHGPSTPLAKKAKDNLQKVESILKSLKEIEGQ